MKIKTISTKIIISIFTFAISGCATSPEKTNGIANSWIGKNTTLLRERWKGANPSITSLNGGGSAYQYTFAKSSETHINYYSKLVAPGVVEQGKQTIYSPERVDCIFIFSQTTTEPFLTINFHQKTM